ncbi:MAG TPA: Flp pilus assembly protein CpaB [Pyrinomonadaceae bacterium]|nr:Flp pilus assembly protein CpaB [Pyrinomonadaceae bacterium]
MRNKRFFVVLGCALMFGLVAAFAVSRYLSSANVYAKSLNSVVVAKVDIPIGAKIIPEQLMVVQFPRESIPDGTFDNPQKLIGRVAVQTIRSREPVTDSRLAPEGSAAGLSAAIPEGYRAMTVKVDDVVGVSGFIQPGTLVDVVVVINPEENTVEKGPVSKIVLQNIKVLANGQNIDKPKDDREANSVKAVTLQVTPEEAEKLALASTEGKLQLVMRNSIDQDDEQTNGVNKRTLLSGDRATPQPEPGSLKSERDEPKDPAERRMKAATDYMRAATDFMTARQQQAVQPVAPVQPPAQQQQQPPAPRSSVEMYEGAKKRNVDFP